MHDTNTVYRSAESTNKFGSPYLLGGIGGGLASFRFKFSVSVRLDRSSENLDLTESFEAPLVSPFGSATSSVFC